MQESNDNSNIVNLAASKNLKGVVSNLTPKSEPLGDNPTVSEIVQSCVSRMRESFEDTSEIDKFNQAFVMIRNKETGGFIYTTYNTRGPELVGTLECCKILAFDNFFNASDEDQ